MDLDELRTVRRTEREKDSLQHLRDTFYEDVAAYLSDLEARRDRAAAEADDPFASQEVRKLTDRIETAEEVSEAIYERRVGKIVKQASFAAADMSANRDGLTEQEAELFDDLVARIKQNKATVFDILAGEGDDADGSADADPADAVVPAADESPAAASELDRAPESTAADASEPAPGGAPGQTPADTTDDVAPGPGPEAVTAGGAGADRREAVAGESDTETGSGTGAGEMLASAMGGSDATETAGADDSRTTDADDSKSTGRARDGGSPADRTEIEPDASDAAVGADGIEKANASDEPRATRDETPTTDGGADLRRTTVRITRDVGSILGVDEREYDLEREDVVTLPATNAEPLVERDAAEPLE